MILEKKFERIKLTKKEFNKLTKKVLKEYHKDNSFTPPEVGRVNLLEIYSNEEMEEIFTEYPEMIKLDDVLNKNLKEMQKRKIDLKGDIKTWAKILAPIIVLGLILPFSIFSLKTFLTAESEKFKKQYTKIIYQYGDDNGDKSINQRERKDFEKKFFMGKDVVINDLQRDMEGFPKPKYSNGQKVPIKDMIRWAEEYKE